MLEVRLCEKGYLVPWFSSTMDPGLLKWLTASRMVGRRLGLRDFTQSLEIFTALELYCS